MSDRESRYYEARLRMVPIKEAVQIPNGMSYFQMKLDEEIREIALKIVAEMDKNKQTT